MMLKIWAKIITDDRIVKDLLYKRPMKYASSDFMTHLMEICYELDIPTPVVLKSHKYNFAKFNSTFFRVGDFVETVDFERLVLENASE